MVFKFLTIALTAISLLANSDNKLSPKQRQEVQQLITETLNKDPEIIIKAIKNYQKNKYQQYKKTAEDKIKKRAYEIFNYNNKLILGNPKAKITIIEFMDYNCGHCRALSKTLKEVYQNNKNVKVVVKDLPILGKNSLIAAKAAYAAYKQDKYKEFHYATMSSNKPTSYETINKTAIEIGLDMSKFQADIDSTETEDYIIQSMNQAKDVNIAATPAMIIGTETNNTFIAGAMPKEEINKILSTYK